MKNQKQTDATRNRIVEAFWQLFEEKKIRHITTGEVACLAGIHRNTFYRYFNSVYDLLDYVEYDLLENIMPYIAVKVVTQTELMRKIHSQILTEQDRRLSLIIKRDPAGFADKYKKILFPVIKENFSHQNEYVIDDDGIMFILSGSIALIIDYFTGGKKRSVEELVDKIMTFSCRICRTQ